MIKNKKIEVFHIGGGLAHHKNRASFTGELKKKKVSLEDFHRADGWVNNLQKDLESINNGNDFIFYKLQMPLKHFALYEEWKIYFEKVLAQSQKEVIITTWSLGTIFITKYLSENVFSQKIKQLHLISSLHNLEEIKDSGFFLDREKVSQLKSNPNIEKVFLYHSSDDPLIPISHMEKYKKEIFPQAQENTYTNQGHFYGVERIEELWENILDIKKEV